MIYTPHKVLHDHIKQCELEKEHLTNMGKEKCSKS